MKKDLAHVRVAADGRVAPEFEQRIRRHQARYRSPLIECQDPESTRILYAAPGWNNEFELRSHRWDRPVFYLLEGLEIPRQFVSSLTGVLLGEVEFWDGPCPGNDYQGVTVTSPEALACLQAVLDRIESGIRIRMRRSRRKPNRT